MRRAPRPNGDGEEARDRSRAGPALPDGSRSAQRRLDVEAAHLGEATPVANDTKCVLPPGEDVRQRTLHGPRITRRRAGDRTLPISRCGPRDDTVEARELALRPVDDFLARVSHGPRRILPYGDGHALPERRQRALDGLELDGLRDSLAGAAVRFHQLRVVRRRVDQRIVT